jgi:NADPH:quinone reductase-like Zn-dependent oxidoreductase
MTGSKKMCILSLRINQKDPAFMKKLIEAGKVKPVIDRSYPLSEVAKALRYYAEGHARGKVVITMSA